MVSVYQYEKMAVIAHSKLVLCVLGFVCLLLYCFCVLCNNVHLSQFVCSKLVICTGI